MTTFTATLLILLTCVAFYVAGGSGSMVRLMG